MRKAQSTSNKNKSKYGNNCDHKRKRMDQSFDWMDERSSKARCQQQYIIGKIWYIFCACFHFFEWRTLLFPFAILAPYTQFCCCSCLHFGRIDCAQEKVVGASLTLVAVDDNHTHPIEKEQRTEWTEKTNSRWQKNQEEEFWRERREPKSFVRVRIGNGIATWNSSGTPHSFT